MDPTNRSRTHQGALTGTEIRYAQVEKAGLAVVVWACKRFQNFVTGLHIKIETDHKPLVPIFMSKNLADITIRLQRMKVRMMRFSHVVKHIPGKALIAADTLSR